MVICTVIVVAFMPLFQQQCFFFARIRCYSFSLKTHQQMNVTLSMRFVWVCYRVSLMKMKKERSLNATTVNIRLTLKETSEQTTEKTSVLKANAFISCTISGFFFVSICVVCDGAAFIKYRPNATAIRKYGMVRHKQKKRTKNEANIRNTNSPIHRLSLSLSRWLWFSM